MEEEFKADEETLWKVDSIRKQIEERYEIIKGSQWFGIAANSEENQMSCLVLGKLSLAIEVFYEIISDNQLIIRSIKDIDEKRVVLW